MPGVEAREGMGGMVPWAGTGDMEVMLARPEMFEFWLAETGFDAANWVLADTLVVAGGGTMPDRDVAAVVIDGSGVAEMKSSKSSSSPTVEARVAD